jgi:hypothetical protein
MILNKKSILYVLFGVLLTIVVVIAYTKVWPKGSHTENGNTYSVNENINLVTFFLALFR